MDETNAFASGVFPPRISPRRPGRPGRRGSHTPHARDVHSTPRASATPTANASRRLERRVPVRPFLEMRASTRRRGTTRHADHENAHPRGRAEAWSARGAKSRAFGDAARDRRATMTARPAATPESAFEEITNRHARSRGDGRVATESEARLVGRRAAALLVDPTGPSEETSEVEKWAAALNDLDARDGPDLERTLRGGVLTAGFEGANDASEAEDDAKEDVCDEADASAREQKPLLSHAEARARMRQVLDISARIRDVCGTRTAELEATKLELQTAEASRREATEKLRVAEARALAARFASAAETKTLRASLADAETAKVVDASTFASKERELRDALRERTLERDRARAGLRDAEMELQALVIEKDVGAGAAEAAAAACDAAAAAETETDELRDRLASARLELRVARAESRGEADEKAVLADELRRATLNEKRKAKTEDRSSQTETEKTENRSVPETSAAPATPVSAQTSRDVSRTPPTNAASTLADRRVVDAEAAAAAGGGELAARRLGDAAAQRQKKRLEGQIDALKARVGTLETALETAQAEATAATASKAEAVGALEASARSHAEELRAMEREVEAARAEAAEAEAAAAAAASAAEKSAEDANSAFEEARRARVDFADARDEAERLECLLEEEKKRARRAEAEASANAPVTLRVNVVDDTVVSMTTVIQGYDETDLARARAEATAEATATTTALMESALESAVHIAREDAEAERAAAAAETASAHAAALEAVRNSARAEARKALESALAESRAALEAAEAAMGAETRKARDEARAAEEKKEAAEEALALATRESARTAAAAADAHRLEVARLRESLSSGSAETEEALARCRSELAERVADAARAETALARTAAERDSARDDAAAKDAELAEYAARTMLHRDFSVSPSPIRGETSPCFGSGPCVSSVRHSVRRAGGGASSRATEVPSSDGVAASAATPARSGAGSAARCAGATFRGRSVKADDEARAIDRTVIEELKETLAEAYERERALESALAEARATNEARTDAADAADADVDVSFSAAAVAETRENVPPPSEKSAPRAGSAARSADISRDVSAYHDAPTPTSVRDAERRTLHDAFADAGAGPFAAAESRFAFSPFGGVAGGLTPCSVSSVDVSSASTPPDYDAREFAALLKRGEREVRRLKARLVASESAPAREE